MPKGITLPEKLGQAAVDKAARRYRELCDRYETTEHKLRELDQAAGAGDDQAFLAAIAAADEAGDLGPDSSVLAGFQAASAARRELEGLEGDLDDAKADLLDLILEHADELAEASRVSEAKARQAEGKAIDALEAALRDRAEAKAIVGLVDRARNGQLVYHPTSLQGDKVGLAQRSGEGHTVADVLGALRHHATGHRPASGLPRMPGAQPLRRRWPAQEAA